MNHRQGLPWDPNDGDIARTDNLLPIRKEDQVAALEGGLHGPGCYDQDGVLGPCEDAQCFPGHEDRGHGPEDRE